MKRIFLSVGIILIVVFLTIFFRHYFSVPSTFLTEEQLIKEIKTVYSESDVKKVQNIVQLDERHVFVPLILENGSYGFAAWTWEPWKKWELQRFDSNGSPQLWTIGEASERYFIWNLPLDEKVAGINFYLIRDRNAWISEDIPFYLPRIQLDQHVALNGQGYGVLKMPDEWVTMTNWLSENEAGRKDQLFSSMFSKSDLVQYGWQTVDVMGQQKEIEQNHKLSGGFGYSLSSDFHFVVPLNEGEVEFGR